MMRYWLVGGVVGDSDVQWLASPYHHVLLAHSVQDEYCCLPGSLVSECVLIDDDKHFGERQTMRLFKYRKWSRTRLQKCVVQLRRGMGSFGIPIFGAPTSGHSIRAKNVSAHTHTHKLILHWSARYQIIHWLDIFIVVCNITTIANGHPFWISVHSIWLCN